MVEEKDKKYTISDMANPHELHDRWENEVPTCVKSPFSSRLSGGSHPSLDWPYLLGDAVVAEGMV